MTTTRIPVESTNSWPGQVEHDRVGIRRFDAQQPRFEVRCGLEVKRTSAVRGAVAF